MFRDSTDSNDECHRPFFLFEDCRPPFSLRTSGESCHRLLLRFFTNPLITLFWHLSGMYWSPFEHIGRDNEHPSRGWGHFRLDTALRRRQSQVDILSFHVACRMVLRSTLLVLSQGLKASDSFNAKKNIVNHLSSYEDTQRLKRGCSSTNKIYVMNLSCPLHEAAKANLISQDSTWHMGRLRCRASARWSFQIHPGNGFDALCVSIPPLDTLQKQQTNQCTLSATDLCGGSLFPIVRSCQSQGRPERLEQRGGSRGRRVYLPAGEKGDCRDLLLLSVE
jgi:hypothetical protein